MGIPHPSNFFQITSLKFYSAIKLNFKQGCYHMGKVEIRKFNLVPFDYITNALTFEEAR